MGKNIRQKVYLSTHRISDKVGVVLALQPSCFFKPLVQVVEVTGIACANASGDVYRVTYLETHVHVVSRSSSWIKYKCVYLFVAFCPPFSYLGGSVHCRTFFKKIIF